MIDEILSDLKEYVIAKNLNSTEKQSRKKIANKLLLEVRQSLFQLFYEEFLLTHLGTLAIPREQYLYQSEIPIIQLI